jgi:hypothetical protein
MTSEELEKLMAARAGGEDLPESEILDEHFVRVPRDQKKQAVLEELVILLKTHPEPSCPERLERILNRPKRNWRPLLAVAVFLLLIFPLKYWFFQSKNVVGHGQRVVKKEKTRDWRLDWLDRKEENIVVIGEPVSGFSGASGGQAFPFGSESEKKAAWTKFVVPYGLRFVQKQWQGELWIPEKLPSSLVFSEARIVHPRENKKAFVLVFKDSKRQLVFFQEVFDSFSGNLDPGKNRLIQQFRKGELRITMLGEHFSRKDWRELVKLFEETYLLEKFSKK